MKNNNQFKTMLAAVALIFSIAFISSCEKDEHKPPVIVFKTGGSYTSADATVTDSVTVGVTVTKTEDELKTLNVSYGAVGSTSTTTYLNYSVTTAEEDGFSKDVKIPAPAAAGTVQWTFTATDRDGNVANVSLKLTRP